MTAYVRTLKAILHSLPFSEPHEGHCLALFMCPPLSSLELCFMIALVRTLKAILHSPPFFWSPMIVIALRCSCVVHLRVWSYVS